MMYKIAVRPADSGWSMRIDSFAGEERFLGGAKAEDSARAIANRLAATGEIADIEIWLRDGQLAKRLCVSPPPPRLVSA